MKKIILILFICVLSLPVPAQINGLDLSFTSILDQSYHPLDSIIVQNRSRGCDTLLIYPDTVLSMIMVGIEEQSWNEAGFHLSINYPNPFIDHTTFSVNLSNQGEISLLVHNLLGQRLASFHSTLEAGQHDFTFFPSQDNCYILTAITPKASQSIKMTSLSVRTGTNAQLVKTNHSRYKSSHKIPVKESCFEFAEGDTLLLVGYANFFTGSLESGILHQPDADHLYTFQFATNIPCPETPTVTYEGQEYNTIQVLSQCWFKENLNVGTMIPGSVNMEDNGIIEKYCYDNEEDGCDAYGGLYQWDEMMQYNDQQGGQGICPPGWHVPTDDEWKVLEGAIDSQYQMGDWEWDGWDMRGSDIGHKIKSVSGWVYSMNGNDSHGFSLLPGGFRYFNDGNFHHSEAHANLWSSTSHIYEYKWFRFVIGYIIESYRNSSPQLNGFSVRCLKD